MKPVTSLSLATVLAMSAGAAWSADTAGKPAYEGRAELAERRFGELRFVMGAGRASQWLEMNTGKTLLAAYRDFAVLDRKGHVAPPVRMAASCATASATASTRQPDGILTGVTIFTTGYEGRSLDEFLAALRMQGVQLVTDVREAPISRKRGFSRSALTEALHGAGIAYRHIRALGCPKAIRDRYRENDDWAAYTRAFMRHLRTQEAAIEELAALTGKQRTALLCYEADFERCHRTYVARAVATRSGAQICHITASGVVREAADIPAAAGRSGSRSATGRETCGSSP